MERFGDNRSLSEISHRYPDSHRQRGESQAVFLPNVREK